MIERRAATLTTGEGRNLAGVAVPWDEPANVVTPDGAHLSERFEPGAVSLWSADLPLLDGHGGAALARLGAGLELRTEPSGLTFTATVGKPLQPTGASIEFAPLRERRSGGERVISEAVLTGLAVLTGDVKPAYSGATVEARQAQGEIRQGPRGSLEGLFPYDQISVISNSGTRGTGRVRKQRIGPNAFAYVEDLIQTREITLTLGRGAGRTLASRQAGSLALDFGADALAFHTTKKPAATTYWRDFLTSLASGLVLYAIEPQFFTAGVPDATRIIPEPGNPDVDIEVVDNAVLTSLAIVPRTRWPESTVNLRSAPEAPEARLARHWWM